MPRPAVGYTLRGSVDTYSVRNSDHRVDYRVANGQVVIFNIQPVTHLQRLRDAQEKPALYHVKRSREGIWRVGKRVSAVSCSYAAVNGQSNNLTKATWLMRSHLNYQFGESVSEYTLFHNPSVGGLGDTWESIQDKFGFTTDVTKRFAKALAEAQGKGSQTAWVAHSQGGLIFSEGVRYLLNNQSSWALNRLSLNGRRHPENGNLLNRQRVAFHGNANNNLRCKPLFERAGIEIVPAQSHDYDLVYNIIGVNTVSPRKLMGSLIYANHVFDGSIFQSPHTTAQSRAQWKHNMVAGPGRGRGPIQKAFHKTEKADYYDVYY